MKKLLAILGMITCMVALSACGSAQEDPSITEEEQQQLLMAGETNVNAMYQVISAGAEEQYASGVEAVYNGLLSFKSAMEDIGDYVGTSGGTVEVDGDETIVRININGSSHNAIAEMVIDSETADFISIAVNVDYSLGEKMEKAALNTLLGMGTVFVILILICFIISAFGLIAKVQKSDKKPAETQEKSTNNVVEQIVENEELTDDLELVAVISAAVAAYEGSGSTDGFVVRSIRKAHR